VRHAAARGSPRSPASRGNVVPARNWVKLCYWKQPCGTGELLWCLTRPMVSQGGGSTTAWRRCQATARKSSRAEGGKKGKQVGEVPHQRVVLQGSAAIGSLLCSGGFGVVQLRIRGGAAVVDVLPPRRFPACRGRGRCSGLGETPGRTSKPLRSSGGTRRWRSIVAAAGSRRRRGTARQSEAEAAAGVEDGGCGMAR